LRAIVSGKTAKSKPNNSHEYWQIFAGRSPAEPSKRASGSAETKKKKLFNWGEKHGAKEEDVPGAKTTRYNDRALCTAVRTVSDRVVASLCRSSVVHRRLQVGLDARFNLACERAGGDSTPQHTKRTRLLSPITLARRNSSRGG